MTVLIEFFLEGFMGILAFYSCDISIEFCSKTVPTHKRDNTLNFVE
jgi:hypothetical protein